jgi:uncharacterized protein (DUF736 family)
MAQIGTFRNTGAGFLGRIETLTLRAELTLEPIRSRSDKAPDFRVFNNTIEIGVAYRRTSERGNEYLAVLLDDPAFNKPIRCNLLLGGHEELPLMWDRPKAKA